jgi:membrane protease YdiL (CAAX protease family)
MAVRMTRPYVAWARAAAIVVALAGLPVAAMIARAMPSRPVSFEVGTILCALLVGGSIFMVTHIEGASLASMGIGRRFRTSLVWGLGRAALAVFLYGPIFARMIAVLGDADFQRARAHFALLPAWMRVALVVTNGIAEETLYRGYALERLITVTGRARISAALVVFAGGLAHLVHWDWRFTVTTFVAGTIGTAFYLWRRDLIESIVAHVVTDAVGSMI